MVLTLPDMQDRPAAFLGPGLTSAFIQALETGMLINQSLTFWSRVEREGTILRVIVCFVTLAALFQTALAFYTTWNAHITHFGDMLAAESFIWVDKLSPILTISMAGPVQSFLIWRCFLLTGKNWICLCSLVAVLLTSAVCSILVTAQTFAVNFSNMFANLDQQPKIQTNALFILTLASSAALDVAVTTILLVYLSRAKQNVYSSRFRRIMNRLTILIWEAAVPPCVCAIMAVVTYLTLVNNNFWDLTFQAILGKLYVISLFVTLNGRASLVSAATAPAGRLTSMAWVTNTPVRLNITCDIENQRENGLPSMTTNGSSVVSMATEQKPDDMQTSRIPNVDTPIDKD
ncbi:hypothetical protein C8Q75DRAFT_537519 [Abortiporus biennis]|nr:hypothetical protein C8Q75DRAFT_537519 [Abortiporus biennis]